MGSTTADTFSTKRPISFTIHTHTQGIKAHTHFGENTSRSQNDKKNKIISTSLISIQISIGTLNWIGPSENAHTHLNIYTHTQKEESQCLW
jgi:hypothetical protein